jgi:hypothetical protein
MTTATITTTDDVYRFIEQLKAEAERHEDTALVDGLDDALHLGSSGLEILGAIQKTLSDNLSKVEKLLGSDGLTRAKLIVVFVDKAFGR